LVASSSLERLLKALPVNAEEGGERLEVGEAELLRVLLEGASHEGASALLSVARGLFESLCLLDEGCLEQGRWAFVSFPAELMARSLLATLSTPGQTLVPQHYWEQDAGKPAQEIEAQRALLHLLEVGRQRFHPMRDASPIRFVYVAWGLIRFGDRYLLVQREDKDRSRSGVAHWVLTGGRLALKDFPRESRQDALANWRLGPGANLLDALDQTLARELHEEVGLLPEHYKPQRLRLLDGYREVEGAHNNHALTQYCFAIYAILLEPEGELGLMHAQQVSPERMAWFTIDELLNDTRLDGKRAYVNALKVGGDKAARALLDAIPDSGSPSLCLPATLETCAVDLPGSPGGEFLVGKSGKEQLLRCDLTDQEWELLMLLAWHAKGLTCHPTSEHAATLQRGWLVLVSQQAQDVAERLVWKLQGLAALPAVRLVQGQFARLDIDPRVLFLSRSLFWFDMAEEGAGDRLAVRLRTLETRFGRLDSAASEHELSRGLARAIRSIEMGRGPGELSDPDRQFREAFKATQAIGLRKLVYVDKKEYRLSVSNQPN
jgi:8-oxo-dGTP pyrophosphatase MutT (NUDIX family)